MSPSGCPGCCQMPVSPSGRPPKCQPHSKAVPAKGPRGAGRVFMRSAGSLGSIHQGRSVSSLGCPPAPDSPSGLGGCGGVGRGPGWETGGQQDKDGDRVVVASKGGVEASVWALTTWGRGGPVSPDAAEQRGQCPQMLQSRGGHPHRQSGNLFQGLVPAQSLCSKLAQASPEPGEGAGRGQVWVFGGPGTTHQGPPGPAPGGGTRLLLHVTVQPTEPSPPPSGDLEARRWRALCRRSCRATLPLTSGSPRPRGGALGASRGCTPGGRRGGSHVDVRTRNALLSHAAADF